MPNVSRKAIAAALLTLIAGPSSPFAGRSGRRVTKPEQAASPGKPALFLVKLAERIQAGPVGQPPQRTLLFQAFIFTDVTGDADAIPADQIDDLLDYVTVQLASDASTGLPLNGMPQTLGSTTGVYDCVIDGTPPIRPGDLEGKGLTRIPITVTLDQYP
jgi:hypothetical protein